MNSKVDLKIFFSVDWCGCSPNDFKPDDWSRLQATEQKQLFFGRKFEPVINQLVILQLEEWLHGPYPVGYENLNSYWQSTFHIKDKSPPPNQALLTIASQLVKINSKSNLMREFYEPLQILEVTDYFELDVYKGFLIRHTGIMSDNVTVELETWFRPSHHHAQVSKSNKLAKKIMQLDVSTDFDQKELISRNFARIMGEGVEPVLTLKLSGTSNASNSTAVLTIVWLDPSGKVQETSDLTVDITTTSINFANSNLVKPLTSGAWTVKVLQKKSLIGLTKFFITPSATDKGTKLSQNDLDEAVASFYLTKDTCIHYNQKNIREIVSSYLNNSEKNKNESSIPKFSDCKKASWSSLSPDPKSALLMREHSQFDGSS